jgi:hypothetical protein
MADYNNNPSGRKYPVTLKAFVPSTRGEILAQQKEVFNDVEHASFVREHGRRNNIIKEFPSARVLEEIEQEREQKEEDARLDRELKQYNLKTAKRVYRTYPLTQGLAWFGGIVAIILGYLKIAETFHLWPYKNK